MPDSSTTGPRLVVVAGATGNQGGSVARRFLREGGGRFRVRGLTRDPGSGPARDLTALGAEMVRADLDDAGSLRAAVEGASVIFSVTDYWEPLRPAAIRASRARAAALGLRGGVREYAGRVELARGRNMADAAAATAGSLDANGFIASTLSHAGRCSGGRLGGLYHFDAKADVFPCYVRETHPRLAAKMSCVQTGYFMASHRILPDSYFAKLRDGSFEMRFCTDPRARVPQLDPAADMGAFVYAVYQMSSWCGRDYMAEGTRCTWPEWIAAWSRATGAPATYRQVSRGSMIKACGDEDLGGEIADMYDYASDPGYEGGMTLLRAEDLHKVSWLPPQALLFKFQVGG